MNEKFLITPSCLALLLSLILAPFSYAKPACFDITQKNGSCKNKKNPPIESEKNYTNSKTDHMLPWLESKNKTLCDERFASINSDSVQQIKDIYAVIEASHLSFREKFICEMEVKVREQMQAISYDRKLVITYIQKEKDGSPLSDDEKINLTQILIKYRLFKNENKICSPYAMGDGTCYFSSARFNVPSEVLEKIRGVAQNYKKEPQCFLKGKKYALTSKVCEQALLSRIQVLPTSLVLTQMVQESGWGDQTSKWASEYNNLLGLQISFSNPKSMACYKNCRCAGETKSRCALKFEDVSGGVYEHAMRFNSSPFDAYNMFRKDRNEIDELALVNFNNTNQQCKNAEKLIPHLAIYAENPKYVQEVCNKLSSVCTIMEKCPKYN